MPYIEIKKSLYYEILKRLIDVFLSSFLIVIFSPVILFVAIAIRFDSKGPVFADTPMRAGKDGKLFKIYKFRL